MTNKFLWVDERTTDYIGRDWDFTKDVRKSKGELVVCGEGSTTGLEDRAIHSIGRFIEEIDVCVQSDCIDDISGFIVDVNMPVKDLGIISKELTRFKTQNGTYTGFQIAQYVLCNKRSNCSPFGDSFVNHPILFLSISQFHYLNAYTDWMGDSYQDYKAGEPFMQFTHLEKKIRDSSINQMIGNWVKCVVAGEIIIKKGGASAELSSPINLESSNE